MNETAEQLARNLFHSLSDINEFGRLLRVGMFVGDDHKSISKADAFLRKIYKETLQKIEDNEWYKTEKAAIQAVNIKEVMEAEGSSGEYDPNYEVKMADVFRKVVK